MNDLMKRLMHIEKECNNGKEGVASAKDGDEFTTLKKQIAANLKMARETIKERDEAKANKKAEDTYVIQLNSKFFGIMREAKENAENLRNIQRAQAIKNKPKEQDEIKHRAEIVDLIYQHIAEVENLERRVVEEVVDNSRASLFSGAKSGAGGGKGKGKAGSSSIWAPKKSKEPAAPPVDPTHTDLPDFDVEGGLAQLRKNDQEIDEDVALIGKGVNTLHQIALSMNEELQVQDTMINTITDKVDNATENLNKLNTKLKETLNKVGGAEKCIVNIVLLIFILGIGAFIYNQFA